MVTTNDNDLTAILRAARLTLEAALSPEQLVSVLTIDEWAERHGASRDVQNLAAELTLRARRRIVALVAPTVRAGNPQLSPGATIGRLPRWLDRRVYYRWRQYAAPPWGVVSDPVFDGYVGSARACGDDVTVAGLLLYAGASLGAGTGSAENDPDGQTGVVATDRACLGCGYEWRSAASECDRCVECPSCKHAWLK